MNAMPIPAIDPEPVFALIREKGGESSFTDAIRALMRVGIAEAAARDALWRLLSDGSIEFTIDRQLTIARPRMASRAG
jgi:hypothetical protein